MPGTEEVHITSISQLDKPGAFRWQTSEEIKATCKPLETPMKYKFKLHATGNIEERKARRSICGDFMRPYTHYDPDTVATFAADKATIRLVLAFTAAYARRFWALLHKICFHGCTIHR